MDDDELLTAGAVARRLGVAVTTLRSWHQRYGLGPTGHEPGQHRRYTTGDLGRLEHMQRLVAEGVPAKEAARWALRAPVPTTSDQSGPRSPAGRPGPVAHRDGGPGLALGRADVAARGLARATLRLDELTVRRIIADAVLSRGVVDTWERVLRPVLAALGERAGHTGRLVEVEHLLSGCVSAVLGAVPRPEAPARVLLACADEEQHSLPIEALAAALASSGVAARTLGARVPPSALAAAVRRTGPQAVLLWSHGAETGAPAQLSALLAHPRRPTVVAAGGPGWTAVPPGVATPGTLTEAVALLAAAGR